MTFLSVYYPPLSSNDPNFRRLGTHHEPEMIPLSSAGAQPRGQHPLRIVNTDSGQPNTFQAYAQSEANVPTSVSQAQFRQQPTVIDLTSGDDAQEREPPAKRPRLDIPTATSSGTASPVPGVGGVGGGDLRSAPGGPTTPRPPSTTSWRGRPVWSFQSLVSETPGVGDVYGDNALAQGGKPASPPPLPTPPWRFAPQEPSSSRLRDSSPVKAVQTTPYRIETPAAAPALKDESECPRWFSKAHSRTLV